MAQQLEDFYECIENIPQEIQDVLTRIRELDLIVENSKDAAKSLIIRVFEGRKNNMSQQKCKELEVQIRHHHDTAKDAADEKIRLVEQKLHMILKARDELDIRLKNVEKEHPEFIEKRKNLELMYAEEENQQNIAIKEKKKPSHVKNKPKPKHPSLKEKKRRDSNASTTSVEKCTTVSTSSSSLPEPRPASANSGPLVAQQQTASSLSSVSALTSGGLVNSAIPVNSNLPHRNGHIGPGGNAIAAAASQAIAATQQMQQGRRTASLKASYEAINNGGVHAAEFSRELAGAAQTAIAAIQESSKKNKKKVASSNVASTNIIPVSTQQVQQQTIHQQQSHQHQSAAAVASAASQQNGATTNSSFNAAVATVAQTNAVADTDNHEWIYDPNEPRYCICNQISYGEMVACDNADCPFEWFHYPCVNITTSPKGKWYCPQCTTTMKRRAGRKN